MDGHGPDHSAESAARRLSAISSRKSPYRQLNNQTALSRLESSGPLESQITSRRTHHQDHPGYAVPLVKPCFLESQVAVQPSSGSIAAPFGPSLKSRGSQLLKSRDQCDVQQLQLCPARSRRGALFFTAVVPASSAKSLSRHPPVRPPLTGYSKHSPAPDRHSSIDRRNTPKPTGPLRCHPGTDRARASRVRIHNRQSAIRVPRVETRGVRSARGFCTRGWSWGHHPNFFAEQLFWGVLKLIPIIALPSAPSVATQGAAQPPQGSGAACDQNPANAGSGVNESSDRPVSTYTQAASLIGADIMDATRVHGAPRIRTASASVTSVYHGVPLLTSVMGGSTALVRMASGRLVSPFTPNSFEHQQDS